MQQQAQQQATDDVNKQQKQENEKNQSQEDQTKQQEDFLKTTASDPRLQDLRTDMQKTSGVKSVTQPLVNDNGDAAVYTVISDYAPSSTRDRGHRQRPARQHDPHGHQGPGHDRRRGRHRRPATSTSRPDQQQAPR